MNLIDYLILGVLATVVVCILIFLIRRKKQGKSNCGCCSHKEQCKYKNCK